jgi:hypothetical protein
MLRYMGMATTAGLACLAIGNANAALLYDSGLLSFESAGQSMWGTGEAFRKEDSVFLGEEWTSRLATIGGIAGSANAVVIPALGAVTVPVFEPRVFVPTPTWTNPLKGYFTGCNCWKDVTIKPATNAVTADTRTGAELKVRSSGKVGLEFGYAIDSGSIDTKALFRATAEVPDLVQQHEYFSLNPKSSFDSGMLTTQSPKIEAYFSAIMKLSGSMDARACALTLGCVNSGSVALPTVNVDQRILSIDPNSLKLLDGVMPDGKAFAEVPIANQSLKLEGGATIVPPVVGFKLTGPGGLTLASSLPPTPAVSVDIAEVTVQVPNIATSTASSGLPMKSSGRDDLLSAQLDIDGAATLLSSGSLPPAGINVDLIDAGSFKLSASVDIIDVDAGPVLGVTQDFDFTAALMTDIVFDKPVQIANLDGLHDHWTGLWSELPTFAIGQTTTFTPKFWLDAVLLHELGLDLGLVGTLDLLKLGATGSVGGVELLNFNTLSLNNLLGIGNSLFETPRLRFSVYDDTFDLQGFNVVDGMSFTVVAVPEPTTVAMMLLGLLALQLKYAGRAGAVRRLPS